TQMLGALCSAWKPALAARARALGLDPRVRVNEAMAPLTAQISLPEMREPAWEWVQEHYDELVARLGLQLASRIASLPTKFCDAKRADEVQAFFATRAEKLNGGPRTVAQTLETIRLCAARTQAQSASA